MSDNQGGLHIERNVTITNIITLAVIVFGALTGWMAMSSKVHRNTDALSSLASSVKGIESDVTLMLLPFSNDLKEHEDRLRTLESYVSGAKVQMKNVLDGQSRIEKKLDLLMGTFVVKKRDVP